MPPLRLIVLACPEAPELELLSALRTPPLGIARTLAELRERGVSEDDLRSCNVLLCGGGVNPQTAIASAAVREVFKACPGLRWVHTCNAGVNALLFEELVSSSVILSNAQGIYSPSLAEWTIFACLYFAKDLPRLRAQQAAADWHPYEVEELRGKTLAVLGYGDIGQAAAQLARAFGMRVVALRRRPAQPDAVVDRYFPAGEVGLHALCAEADYLCCATPLTDATRGLLSAAALRCLRPHAVVMNIGRGACVDEAALLRALQSGAIRGAALDVFEVEPLPKDSPLWSLPNVLLSPHNADRTKEGLPDAVRGFLASVPFFEADQALSVHVVDKNAGY